jgi:hypothetical protein
VVFKTTAIDHSAISPQSNYRGLFAMSKAFTIFGAIGAGVGVGVDALLNLAMPGMGAKPRRVLIAPTVWRHVGGVVIKWRW